MTDYTSATANHIMSLFNRHLRKVAEQTLYKTPVLYEFATKAPLPGGSGKTIFIPKHIGRDGGIRTLTEGTIIGTCATSTHYYSATVSGFGDVRRYSDFLEAVKEIPGHITADIRGMSERAAEKIDQMIRLAMCAGGSTYWIAPEGAAASYAAVNTAMNLKQRFLFDANTVLAGKLCPRYPDGFYWGAFHPRQTHDLFINTSATANPRAWLENTEIGASKLERATMGRLGGIRIFETTTTPRRVGTAAKSDLSVNASGYQAMVMGPGAVGAVDLANMRLKTYVKPLGQAGALDPIDQVMTAGVKFYFAAVAMDRANRYVWTASGYTL